MYELIKISEHDAYVDCPAKIGIVKTGEGHAVTIDSGSDKDAGKKVLKHIDAEGLKLDAVFATHSHADHIGGCKLLQDRTGCRVFAAGIECDITNHTALEPALLYGGFPLADLQHKFLMAQESVCEKLTPDVLPDGFEIIPLPGHSFDMIGIKTADGNVFLGDVVSAEETLKKYGIAFMMDVGAHLDTLEKLKTLDGKMFVPAHSPATDDIASLAQVNIDATIESAEKIVELCAQPVCFDKLLQGVFNAYGITMNTMQFALMGSTVRSYLAYLANTGKVKYFFDDNIMYWEKA